MAFSANLVISSGHLLVIVFTHVKRKKRYLNRIMDTDRFGDNDIPVQES